MPFAITGLRWAFAAQQLTSLRAFHASPQPKCCRRTLCSVPALTSAAASSDAATAAAAASNLDSPPVTTTGHAADAASELDPGLYIVSTPIGNLEDITLRALRVLRTASLVLAEDTRHTAKLFSRYDIHTRLSSFHQHNERHKQALVLRQLQQGAAIALVCDAGTPGINDPGTALVAAAVAAGLNVIPVPGASAVLAAVVASGLPTDQFLFCGFTAPKSGARQKQFASLAAQEATLAFYVSPHSLLAALEDAAQVLGGNRQCCLARELTKRHEEFWRGSLGDALLEFRQRGPRGEFVLLIAGGSAGGDGGETPLSEEQIVGALREAVAAGESPSSAAKSVAKQLGQNRKLCYALSLGLQQQQGSTTDDG